MSLGLEQVHQIATLARLELTDEQTERYSGQLSAILELVDELRAADTTGVEAMNHPLGMTQRLRPDTATEPNRRDAFQEVAPAVDNGLYLVPKVI
ncbi:MAG: Asp-tRNA(Asn)/Glu-tRNA(Gln) amidotransferase subunit GatC [Nevskiaceae bacterium]|nr:MAG: Asp-tRNA(Asn)/Glu-tRNA(Gln) amidotransferase subunit GatC [Nevskiaceae bacterium]TBR74452.1 MAG: Asp-tRNA(Asn)/Glu-tRNA(Gln) amidotransferase subunit GatC [Nevskiaceae bacterium]